MPVCPIERTAGRRTRHHAHRSRVMSRSSRDDFTDGQSEPFDRDPYDRRYGPEHMDDDFDLRRNRRRSSSGPTVALIVVAVAVGAFLVAGAVGFFFGYRNTRTANSPVAA